MNWYDDIEDDDALVLPCRKCGTPICDESDYCDACGEFDLGDRTSFMADKPIWLQGLWLTFVTVLIYQMVAMGCIG